MKIKAPQRGTHFICLVLIIAGISNAHAQFRGSTWGASPTEVKQQERARGSLDGSRYLYRKKTEGRPITVLFGVAGGEYVAYLRRDFHDVIGFTARENGPSIDIYKTTVDGTDVLAFYEFYSDRLGKAGYLAEAFSVYENIIFYDQTLSNLTTKYGPPEQNKEVMGEDYIKIKNTYSDINSLRSVALISNQLDMYSQWKTGDSMIKLTLQPAESREPSDITAGILLLLYQPKRFDSLIKTWKHERKMADF